MADIVAARVIIPVKTNASQATRDLNNLNSTIDRTSVSVKKSTKNMAASRAEQNRAKKSASGLSGSFDSAALGAIATVTAVTAISNRLVKLASDAEETKNKFNVTFSSIRSEATLTSKNLSKSFGLSAQEADKLLSNTGDLLTGFGFTQKGALDLSKDVNTLAADLASFTNIEGGVERASAALTAALFGEREAAKALGIVITENDLKNRLAAKGLDKLTGQSLLQAKAQETLLIAQEQSKNAIGDFARSADSAANVSRRVESRLKDLGATIGKELLPGVSETGLLFLKVTEDIKGIVASLGAVIKAILAPINLVIKQIKAYGAAIDAAKKILVDFGIINNEVTQTLDRQRERMAFVVANSKKATRSIRRLSGAYRDYKKDALGFLAASGDVIAQLTLLDKKFAEQSRVVERAGMETTSLEKFFLEQRKNQLSEYFANVSNIEGAGWQERQVALEVAYGELLKADNLSSENRLAAQRAFAEQSKAIEADRMAAIRQGVQSVALVGQEAVNLGQKITQLQNAQIQSQIENLKKRGASEEEIEKKRRELQRKQARDAKAFGIAQAIINTSLGITRAYADYPFFLATILAGIIGAAGAVEIAAIASAPIPAQFGGDFTVKPGNQADSGLLRVNQGENVSITPTRFSGDQMPKSIKLVVGNQEIDAYIIDSMNRNLNNGKVQSRRKGVFKAS
jgi:hypothetical protein